MSLDKTGDLARARGDHAGAKAAYQECLELRRALATQLDTPQAQRDLAVSLYNMTRVNLSLGDKD